jgi:peptide-methionine (S)-S-oxide reductase
MMKTLHWAWTLAALWAAAVAAQPRADAPPRTETAIFAGGCFWCVEADFDKVDGVLETTSGYIGGRVSNPTYSAVSAGGTGHTEAVKIIFDPARISYAQLLEKFWPTIDPTVKDQQFCDVGSQYRSGIFPLDQKQLKEAEASKAARQKSKPFKAPIVTEITLATTFYPAEEYHQDYYLKNPIRYRYYRTGCGRDARLKDLWGRSQQ